MGLWNLDLDLAKKAIRAQKRRRNENIKAWAKRLADDICAAGEDPYPITQYILQRMVENRKNLRKSLEEE